MVGFKVKFTKQAVKDLEYLKAANLSKKAKKLVDIMKENIIKIIRMWKHYE